MQKQLRYYSDDLGHLAKDLFDIMGLVLLDLTKSLENYGICQKGTNDKLSREIREFPAYEEDKKKWFNFFLREKIIPIDGPDTNANDPDRANVPHTIGICASRGVPSLVLSKLNTLVLCARNFQNMSLKTGHGSYSPAEISLWASSVLLLRQITPRIPQKDNKKLWSSASEVYKSDSPIIDLFSDFWEEPICDGEISSPNDAVSLSIDNPEEVTQLVALDSHGETLGIISEDVDDVKTNLQANAVSSELMIGELSEISKKVDSIFSQSNVVEAMGLHVEELIDGMRAIRSSIDEMSIKQPARKMTEVMAETHEESLYEIDESQVEISKKRSRSEARDALTIVRRQIKRGPLVPAQDENILQESFVEQILDHEGTTLGEWYLIANKEKKYEIHRERMDAQIDNYWMSIEEILVSIDHSLDIDETSLNKYEGDLDGDVPHGSGSLIYSDGSRYDGSFESGKRSGYGTLHWSNGDKYCGDFQIGTYLGKGRFTWANGDAFEGIYRDGLRHGEGLLKSNDGSTYEGMYEHGERSGLGRSTYATGDIFVGHWKHNRRNGKGKYTWDDGSVYDGDWKDNQRHGKGEIKVSSEHYVGDFCKGAYHGQGKWKRDDGSRYDGLFQDGRKHGKGVYIFADGNIYAGQWENGSAHGVGAYTTKGYGDDYEGEWINGSRHGSGTVTYADGLKYIGMWENGKEHGDGSLIYPDGTKHDVSWKNGEKISS